MIRTLFFILFSSLPWITSCALLGGGGSREFPRAKGYEVVAPSSWKETSTNGESDKAYLNSAKNIATVTSSCSSESKFSLEVLTKQLLMGSRNIKYKEKKKISVDGQEGLYSDVQSTLDAKPFYLLIFVLPKGDCIFDFTLVSPKLFTDLEKQEFLVFISSFKHGTN